MDSLYGRRAVGRKRLGTLLADALLPVKSHSVASWERLSANKQTKKQIEIQIRALTDTDCAFQMCSKTPETTFIQSLDRTVLGG